MVCSLWEGTMENFISRNYRLQSNWRLWFIHSPLSLISCLSSGPFLFSPVVVGEHCCCPPQISQTSQQMVNCHIKGFSNLLHFHSRILSSFFPSTWACSLTHHLPLEFLLDIFCLYSFVLPQPFPITIWTGNPMLGWYSDSDLELSFDSFCKCPSSCLFPQPPNSRDLPEFCTGSQAHGGHFCPLVRSLIGDTLGNLLLDVNW